MLELAELLKKGGGLSISQQTVVATPAMTTGGSFDQLQQAVSEALFGRTLPPSDPVEATVVPDPFDF